MAFECRREVARVVVTDLEGDVGNGSVGGLEQLGGELHAHALRKVEDGFTEQTLEELHHPRCIHADTCGQFTDLQYRIELGLQYAAGFAQLLEIAL